MTSSMIICMLIFISSSLVFSWKHIFVMFLLMDFLGLILVLSMSDAGINSLILLLVLQVYSSTLSVSLLVWALRGFGSDKARTLF